MNKTIFAIGSMLIAALAGATISYHASMITVPDGSEQTRIILAIISALLGATVAGPLIQRTFNKH